MYFIEYGLWTKGYKDHSYGRVSGQTLDLCMDAYRYERDNLDMSKFEPLVFYKVWGGNE